MAQSTPPDVGHVCTAGRTCAARSGPSRRAVLAGGGAGAVVWLLAACGSEGSTDQQEPAPGADGTTDGSEPTGSGLVDAGQTLAATADVPVGGALAVTVGGVELLVTQPVADEFAAFSAICTHEGCSVAPDADDGLRCPCHASRFDLATGEVLGGPAPTPLPQVDVVVEDGNVVSA
ncbi:Rieske (2Fe-2S) protein [Oerskovia flava]|uniref:Rieske (2Fe-2S) protein n=1 Tax=Oerskovia flava TaxID=2986422 RepID=UPI002240BB78|nr:Rieske (2Fe-2S) protein [Oerskovia sp. JB1-3-2]